MVKSDQDHIKSIPPIPVKQVRQFKLFPPLYKFPATNGSTLSIKKSHGVHECPKITWEH